MFQGHNGCAIDGRIGETDTETSILVQTLTISRVAVPSEANVKIVSAGYISLDGNDTELPMPKRIKEFDERLQGA